MSAPKYPIDANLPRRFAPWSGGDCTFVHDPDPRWSDTRIWQHALDSGATIVTKDADFSHRALMTSKGPHVIHFRTGNLSMAAFHDLVTRIWSEACAASTTCRVVYVYRDRIETIS